MNKINFVNLGKEEEKDLDFKCPIVYKSESLISSMSYAGPATKIKESTTFTDNLKNVLIKIKGQVSLGSTDGELRNVHIYSSNAVHLDGIERICYLKQDSNQLIVSEYSGNRGAKYSALYKILNQELCDAGFANNDNKFKINEIDIPKFVEILNHIINQRQLNKYELCAVNEIDSILIDKKRYYYYKVYWGYTDSTLSLDSNAIEDNVIINNNNIDMAIKVLLDYSKFCNDKNELIKLSEKIDKVKNIITRCIQNIDEIDDLSSGI